MDRIDGPYGIDMEHGWTRPEGFPGVELQFLMDTLDETKRTGIRSRAIKFEPGSRTPTVMCHEFWEESILVSGDMEMLDESSGEWHSYNAPAVFTRPPGKRHGPFGSKNGCLLVELQFFIDQ